MTSPVFQKKIALPVARNVSPLDVTIAGRQLTLIKQKGFLFNHYSTVTIRSVVLLRNGLLMVYKKDNEGWLMDLKRIDMLKIKRTRSPKKPEAKVRTLMDFKTEKGTISMVAIGQTGSHWIEALTGLTKEQVIEEIPFEEAQETVEEKVSSVSLYQEETLKSTVQSSRSASTYSIICPGPNEVTQPKEVVQPVKEISVVQPVKKQPIAVVHPEKTVRVVDKSWRRPAVSQLSTTTESTTGELSVRHGERSVATLRNMIEKKAQNSLRKSRSLKTAVPTAALVAEKKKIFEDDAVHRNPGISRSAPAALMQDETKKEESKKIRGSYNGCFDSIRA